MAYLLLISFILASVRTLTYASSMDLNQSLIWLEFSSLESLKDDGFANLAEDKRGSCDGGRHID